MKNFTLKAFLFFSFLSITTYAQNGLISKSSQKKLTRCYSDEYNNSLRAQNPNMMGSDQFEQFLKPHIEAVNAQRSSNQNTVIYTIPVVFHILHNGEIPGNGANISDAQALSQLTVMNEDFRRILNTPGYNTNPVGADVEVEFCLAQTDPDGNATTGIHRVNIGQDGINETSLGDAQAQMDALKPSSIWDPSKYMNMWSVGFNGGSGLLGYAQFPGGPANTDGVVSDYRHFGSSDYNDGSFTLNPPYDKGRTMTHEVGHFLGLFHTFQGGCAAPGDQVDDTPAVATSNGGCPTGIDSCPSEPGLDMVENYMDYTNDTCMNTFTQGQKARVLAVMNGAPNRASLASSTACTSPSTPLIDFGSTSPGQVIEGSDCNYQDIVIDLTMSIPASASATASVVHSGTATENSDFELINNAVTFAQGSTTASNAITLRVHNDSFVETDETIDLAMNVATGGDAVASTTYYTLTITNDDAAVTSTSSTVLFSDGFETYTDFDINPVGGWTMLDNDGDATYAADNTDFANEGYTGTFIVFNPSATTPASGAGWAAHSGDKGYYCFNSNGSVSGTPENDDYIFTPQINLTGTGSEVKFWAQGLTDNYAGGERFQVGVSTTDTNPASFTYVTPAPYVIPTLEWAEYSYDLSAYDGQNIYITIHVVSADEFVFMLDDFSVTTNVSNDVQTSINTTTADTINLNGTGNAFFTDSASNNIMLDVDNTGGFDFGCTTASVSRDAATAGADAVMYTYAGITNYVTAKTFDITTTNASTSDNSTVSFYFTEAEIAGWEAVTGNSRTELYVIKEGTDEVKPVSITSFGSNLKLTASLTTGLSGTYVFGTQTALNVTSFELSNAFSIYPNPTTDVLNIKISENNLPDGYKIYNMLGQLINEVEINSTSDLNVNTSEFSNGMYFIKITKDNNAISLPFIKK